MKMPHINTVEQLLSLWRDTLSKKARRLPAYKPGFDRTPPTDNIIELTEFQNRRPRKKARIDIVPRNLNQETLLFHLQDETKDIVFAIGPAGTGKSYMATLMAIQALRDGRIDKIVITRPNVAVDDRDIGYLPGDVIMKMTPWMKPIIDIFEEHYHPKEVVQMMQDGIIEAVPIAFVRGRTFKNAMILIDEAQGTTPASMISLLTRIGEGSKMIVTGDLDQTDHAGTNGLADFLDRFTVHASDRIALVRFETKDVERHPAVREILKMYSH